MAKKPSEKSRRKKPEKIRVKLSFTQRLFYSLGITFFLIMIFIFIGIAVAFFLFKDQLLELLENLGSIGELFSGGFE